MAVGAHHFALRDLVGDRLPAAIAQARADIEELVAEVIELEHYRVGLAAVDTRMRDEVFDQVRVAFLCEAALAAGRGFDVIGAVGDVMLVVIFGSARTAIVVPLSSFLAPPAEFLDGFGLVAPTASAAYPPRPVLTVARP
jgi:hypothetical protein